MLLFHRNWNLNLVVHGDDMTCLGVKESLDKYEAALRAVFEIKVKGRLGTGESDDKQIRVLNRIVRVEDEGLRYEPDPRHVDLLLRDLGLDGDDVKPSPVPGTEPTFDETIHVPDDDLSQIVNACITAANNSCAENKQHLHVTFDEHITYADATVPPYPNNTLLHGPIGASTCQLIPPGHDRYTGLSTSERSAIKSSSSLSPTATTRSIILKRVLREGAGWEVPTSELICAVSKRLKPKRVGVKAAKAAERIKQAHGKLDAEDSTTFRALAARANYLALDRPDIAYASKELCRCFANPTREAYDALRKLARYLKGCPRLVWRFPFQKSCAVLDSMVDTDFAGVFQPEEAPPAVLHFVGHI